MIICLIYCLLLLLQPWNFKLSGGRDHICFIHCGKVGTHCSACGRSLINTCWRNENQSNTNFDGYLLGWENGRLLCLSLEHFVNSEIMQSAGYLQSSSLTSGSQIWFAHENHIEVLLKIEISMLYLQKIGFNSVRSEPAISLPADSDAMDHHHSMFRNYRLKWHLELLLNLEAIFSRIQLFFLFCDGIVKVRLKVFSGAETHCFTQQPWRDNAPNTIRLQIPFSNLAG